MLSPTWLLQAMSLLQPALDESSAAAVVEAAPYLLEGSLLQQLLEELAQSFPEQPPAYMLQQHVKVGASSSLAPYQNAAAELAMLREQQAKAAAGMAGGHTAAASAGGAGAAEANTTDSGSM